MQEVLGSKPGVVVHIPDELPSCPGSDLGLPAPASQVDHSAMHLLLPDVVPDS